jgi:hypothetical protein
MIEHILLRTAAFAAFGSAAMAVYLVALRFVAWDLVPASAMPHVQWWKRHARAFLLTSLVITAGALSGLVVLAILR